ncbi:MAG: alpha-amylase family glycosyl hydrolase, partial [Kiritimatiellia bacterium]
MRFRAKNIAPGILAILFATISSVQAEVMLQFFNMSWQEIIDKMPEIAENGYTSLWLPPPQKASGDLSVGYDLWDPFDIGGHPQRTGGRTRYGTEEEMLRLIETAHRHGLRVYFDNIMNHRAFDIPGYNENTPIDLYPGMLPEDFHLRVTEEGFYRPWGNTVNWGSTWEVQNQYLSGLIDIAHETPNSNFGPALGYTHPKIEFVRHPDNPEFYDFHPTEGHVGFGSPIITTNVIAENSGFYKEDVGSYLMRSIRWLVDYTKLDGLRLDAVKHVPAYFFGKQSGDDKDGSSDGYIGQAQWQYNMTRGLSDWNNHRDSNFNILQPRDDLLVFGEHMGEPPGYGEFFESGMRLLDAKTHSTLNNLAWIDLNILQTSDYVPNMQFGKNLGIYYAKSHDDNIAYGEHLHYALNLTREGIGNIYTDGNRQAPTLGESGGAFPRHANTKPFGQFGDTRVPNLVNIHNNLARGGQYGAWADNDVVSYTRRDFSENDSMTDGDATTLHFMLNRNWDFGAYREIPTPFPEGSILWQYADGGGNFYHQVTDGKIKVTVPPAGYFAFSWRSPEESRLWKWSGGKPITLLSDGLPAGTMTYERWDGPDGDPNFNPYGLPNRGYPEGSEPEEFRYRYTIPRVTSASNLAFYAHVDGSANNVMFKLNGGVPLNSLAHEGGDPRDNPPAISYDMVLGYEQADFHARIWPEKFGSRNADLNQIGSASAETYEFVVGESGFTFWAPDNAANNYTDATGPVFVYHNPEINTDDGRPQITPAPESAVNQPIYLEVKTGSQGDTDRVFVYYTTDGSWPNGAGGFGVGNTRVVELLFRTNIIEGSSSPVTREDFASNYITGWSNNGNGGNGFSAWNLYGTNANAGHFIWSSTEYGHADINSSDVAFGMYGYSNQYANAERGISSWGDNNTFSIDLATQWRDGNRGISLFNSSSTFNETSQIWNFNISTNGYADTGFPYFGD